MTLVRGGALAVLLGSALAACAQLPPTQDPARPGAAAAAARETATPRFIEIGRNEITCDGGCSYLEEFAASIPESELRASPQGLTVVFLAASGAEKRISVSAAQISAQLAAVNDGRNAARPAAAPAAPQTSSSHQ